MRKFTEEYGKNINNFIEQNSRFNFTFYKFFNQ